MLRTIIRLEKLAALRRRFLREGLLDGTAAHFASNQEEESTGNGEDVVSDVDAGASGENHGSVEERLGDAEPDHGPRSLSSIALAATPGILKLWS
jgi:hypothetical protein